jgi:hypothetical protein
MPCPIPEPAHPCAGFRVSVASSMLIAFLDEFGHCGPYIRRTDKRFNQSPVFGLAGFVIPHNQVRHFATFFFKLKANMLAADIKRSAQHPATWEKKGSEFITTRNIQKYAHIREGLSRLLNELQKCHGNIVYYGREKFQDPADSNSSGLYKTVLSHTIRSIDELCVRRNAQFMMILDQHSDRIKLLETAAKTMFSPENPARCLIEPPFQVESHLYQTIQAADWIATLIGRIQAHQVRPEEYAGWEWAENYFGRRVASLSTDSRLWRPSAAQKTLKLPPV